MWEKNDDYYDYVWQYNEWVDQMSANEKSYYREDEDYDPYW